MKFSGVVPAHKEENLLPRGLRAIAAAAEKITGDVEVIVVADRCTDSTAALASEAGAIVVESDARNISAVRNAGAAVVNSLPPLSTAARMRRAQQMAARKPSLALLAPSVVGDMRAHSAGFWQCGDVAALWAVSALPACCCWYASSVHS